MTTTPRKRTTRTRKPAAQPTQELEPIVESAPVIEQVQSEELVYEPYYEPPRFPVAMILMTIALAVTSTIAVISFIDDRKAPEPTPVVVPVNNLSAFTAPIKVQLATDPAKAKVVADAYVGLSSAIAGKTGERLTSSRIFESAHAAFLTDLDAMGGVAVGTEIDQAIGSYLGMAKVNNVGALVSNSSNSDIAGWEPIPFDQSHRVKLVEITAAIAEAAEAAQ